MRNPRVRLEKLCGKVESLQQSLSIATPRRGDEDASRRLYEHVAKAKNELLDAVRECDNLRV